MATKAFAWSIVRCPRRCRNTIVMRANLPKHIVLAKLRRWSTLRCTRCNARRMGVVAFWMIPKSCKTPGPNVRVVGIPKRSVLMLDASDLIWTKEHDCK